MATPHAHLDRFGVALVLSGPSGAGKTTVCRRLLEVRPGLRFSVSCTTRPPRPGEVHGKDYYFIEADDFRRRIAAGEFLEYAEVHGHLYGTLRQEVERPLRQGCEVLLDIDVQGARKVRTGLAAAPLPGCVRFVFVGPPSFAVLESRLRGRGTDREEDIRRRLQNARRELEHWRDYQYVVVNDRVERCVAALQVILAAAESAVPRFPHPPWTAPD